MLEAYKAYHITDTGTIPLKHLKIECITKPRKITCILFPLTAFGLGMERHSFSEHFNCTPEEYNATITRDSEGSYQFSVHNSSVRKTPKVVTLSLMKKKRKNSHGRRTVLIYSNSK
ncbi:uncharacterized protein LOC143226376 isoform X2 [Tachypleus tridentatus]|uniref:uncharacterized protein LOC143226376 isoform X2 n=1 Tax=Tachypleus tridentatus TaxID=6853 RepID=UPI003FD1473F